MPKYNDDNLEQNGTSTAKDVKKQQEQDASTKAAKVAAKGAATYFGGAAGGKAVDLASKTKAGQKILNEGGKKLNSIPGMGKAAKNHPTVKTMGLIWGISYNTKKIQHHEAF